MPNPQQSDKSQPFAEQLSRTSQLAKGDDPSTGTYDFGPRVGKVTGLKIGGRPATRAEALQVIQQQSGLPQEMGEAEGGRQAELEQLLSSREPDQQMRDTMRDLVPMALFPMLSRAGFVRGMAGGAAAGALGGQAGEMIDKSTGSPGPGGDFVDWLSRRGEDAAMGAGTEGLGRVAGAGLRGVGKAPKRLLGGAFQDSPPTLRENVAKTYGIHFTPSQAMDEFSAMTGEPKGSIMRGEESRAFHNPYSRSIAQSGARVRNMASRATVTGLVNDLGPQVPANITGQRVADIIQRVGKPTWQRQVEKLKSVVNARSHGVMVDTAPLREAAQHDLDEMGSKLVGLGQVDDEGNPLWPNTAKMKMLREVAAFPEQMSFANLSSKRTDWMNVSPQMTELISGEAKGTAKHFTQLSTEMLDEAAKGKAMAVGGTKDEGKFIQQALDQLAPGKKMADLWGLPPDIRSKVIELSNKFKAEAGAASKGVRTGGFEKEWNTFRNFTRKGADVFESQVITDAVNKNPESVLRLIKGDDITDALRVRRAIKGYAEMFGEPADKLKAEAAWKKFQVGYLRENVLGPLDGDMTRLADTLDKMTPALKKTIFDDPQSQHTLLRLTQVGKALKDADKNLGVLMGHQDPLADIDKTKGWLRSIRPYIVAKVAWDPTATRFFLRGLAGLADSAPTDSKLKDFVTQTLLGKGSKAALKAGGFFNNRRLGAAMADILRAYDIANIYDEAKRREEMADEYLKSVGKGQGQSPLMQLQQDQDGESIGVPPPQPQ
jgi:hypothetical protein